MHSTFFKSDSNTIKVLLCLFICTFSFTAWSHVEKIYYLKGKIGSKDAALKIYCYDEIKTRYLTYFYVDEKTDQHRAGEMKNNFWEFAPINSRQKEASNSKDIFYLSEKKRGEWSGYYIKAGDTLQIKLEEFSTKSFTHKYAYLDFVKELDPYESYRLSGLSFSATKKMQITREMECQWFVERESGIELFRITDTRKKLNTDSLNKTLLALHLSLIKNCFSFGHNTKSINTSVLLHFINKQYVSFKILTQTEDFILSATNYRQLFTFNVSTGNPLNLEDLVWFEKGTAPTEDPEKLLHYRQKVFAPKLLSILTQLYPKQIQNTNCDLNKPETWQFPVWGLTEKGLAIGSVIISECDMLNWAVLPYSKLAPFLNKNFRLEK